jgi:hypothetical protein
MKEKKIEIDLREFIHPLLKNIYTLVHPMIQRINLILISVLN